MLKTNLNRRVVKKRFETDKFNIYRNNVDIDKLDKHKKYANDKNSSENN